MNILYGKKFKKLREQYADLGEAKLLILEGIAEGKFGGVEFSISMPDNRIDLENTKMSRSTEYYVKYRALIKARETARTAIAYGAMTAGIGLLFKKCFDVAKNNSTLAEEHKKGRDEVYSDIESYCAGRGGQDSWIGDTKDGKHMILRISDEETDDYKDFNALLEAEEEEKALEDSTVIY